LAKTKCMLDDELAFGRIDRSDGSHDYLCIEHYLKFRASPEWGKADPEVGQPECTLSPMKGKDEPPQTYHEIPHEWLKMQGLGMTYDWRCAKCNAWVSLQ